MQFAIALSVRKFPARPRIQPCPFGHDILQRQREEGWGAKVADRLAAVYGLRAGTLTRAPDGPGMEAQGQYVNGPRKSFSGGAGLLSTARDYSRFLQMP